jgi:hypothetical protein
MPSKEILRGNEENNNSTISQANASYITLTWYDLRLRFPLVSLVLHHSTLWEGRGFPSAQGSGVRNCTAWSFLQLPEWRLAPNLFEQRKDHSFEWGLILSWAQIKWPEPASIWSMRFTLGSARSFRASFRGNPFDSSSIGHD